MNQMNESKSWNSLIFMSVESVLEFERAPAKVTFDMLASNGNPIHTTFNRDLVNWQWKGTRPCIWNETDNRHGDPLKKIISDHLFFQQDQMWNSHSNPFPDEINSSLKQNTDSWSPRSHNRKRTSKKEKKSRGKCLWICIAATNAEACKSFFSFDIDDRKTEQSPHQSSPGICWAHSHSLHRLVCFSSAFPEYLVLQSQRDFSLVVCQAEHCKQKQKKSLNLIKEMCRKVKLCHFLISVWEKREPSQK